MKPQKNNIAVIVDIPLPAYDTKYNYYLNEDQKQSFNKENKSSS